MSSTSGKCSTELFPTLAVSVISSSCLIIEIPLSCLNSNYWWTCASCSVRHLPGRLGCKGGTSNFTKSPSSTSKLLPRNLLLLGNSFSSRFTEKLGQFTVPLFHSTGMCDQSCKCRCVLSVQDKQTIKSIWRLVLHEGSLLLLMQKMDNLAEPCCSLMTF